MVSLPAPVPSHQGLARPVPSSPSHLVAAPPRRYASRIYIPRIAKTGERQDGVLLQEACQAARGGREPMGPNRAQNVTDSLTRHYAKNSPGEADAQNARVGLEHRMTRLLTSNTVLAARMRQLDDVFDEGGINRESLPHYSPPARNPQPQSPHQSALATTPAATAIPSSSSPPPPGTDDITPVPSSPTRTRVQTPLSGYTLAGIPVLSIIPLPITTIEIFDGPDVYTFAYARRVGRDLGELMQCQAGQGTTRSLGVVLGRSANGSDAAGSFSTGGSSTSTTGANSIGGCEPAVLLQEPSPPPQEDQDRQLQQQQQQQQQQDTPAKKKKLRFRKIVNVKHRWRAF